MKLCQHNAKPDLNIHYINNLEEMKMTECPKCNQQLKEDAKFCNSCGSKIYETIFCPDCGKQTSTEFASCQSCDTSIEEYAPSTEVEKKKLPKKTALLGGIGLIIAVVLIIFLFNGKRSSSTNYGLYIKDKNLQFTSFSKKDPLQLTSRLSNDSKVDNSDLSDATYTISNFCTISKDGKTVFFPDRISRMDDGLTLYYRNIFKKNDEAIRVDSNITYYAVNDAATIVTYLKGSDGMLYQYDVKKGEKEKIDSEVREFEISDNGKKIVYINEEDRIYFKNDNKDKERIDSNASHFAYVTEDFKTIYYLKDDSLYKKTEGKDKEKISSDVYSVINVYGSGEIYYLKSDHDNVTLMDFVVDDMKKSDAAMAYPEKPSSPYWWDYSTEKEYQAALNKYEIAYAKYEEAYTKYADKEYRDYLRGELIGQTIEQPSYKLYYYTGSEEKVITDSFCNDDYSISYSCAINAAVIAYKAYDRSTFDKVKLSEIKNIYDISDMVFTALYSSSEQYVAVGEVANVIEQIEARNISIDSDGKTIYFIDDIPKDKSFGDLYKVTLSGGKPRKPERYDSDVYSGYFIDDGQYLYFKDIKDEMGELYINKQKIDYDVKTYPMNYNADQKKLTYFTDWNDDKNYGTLNVYQKGRSTKVTDDVTTVTMLPNGDLLYLHDYSRNRYNGDLYLYKNKKAVKIDDDVVSIIPIIDSKYKSGYYYHGW